MSVASKARKEAKKQVDRLKDVKNPNKAQKDRLKREQETVRTATIAVKAEKAAKGKDIGELRELRAEEMKARGLAKGQDKFDEALQARAYADAMRAITGRQKGQGTPYVGPGVQVYLDDGKPALTDKGVVKYDVDTEAYLKRFIPSFQPTAEQLARTGGPGGWAGGLLGGDEDYTYLTPWQQTNLQTLLGSGEDISKQDAALEIMGLPKSLRTDWRQETWGDVFNKRTGLWERADPTKRATAVEDQLRRYKEGLFNPYTGQTEESTGPAPWENVRRIWDILGDDTTTKNINTTLNRTQGSAFQHPYAAAPYKVPHMQTGAGWEGLGAEYQPGTVEGLGLLAGKAHAPYDPLRQGLLNARPSFMGTPSQFTPMNFEGGLDIGDTTKTNTNNTSTLWGDQGTGLWFGGTHYTDPHLYHAAVIAGNQ